MKGALVALCGVFLWAVADSAAVVPEELPARPDAAAQPRPIRALAAEIRHERAERAPVPGAEHPSEVVPDPAPPERAAAVPGAPGLAEIWNDPQRLRSHFATAMMDCECHDVCEEECALVCAHEREYLVAWDRSPRLYALYGSRLDLLWNGEADWGTEQVLAENWTAILEEL